MKEIVLDTETTGLSTREGHRIVEIGCIELDNLVPTKNRFHCYLNPDRKVSEKAFEVHGYTDEFLSKQKRFGQIVDEFLNFIKEKRLVIHNAEFDLSHLNNEMKILGKEKIKNDVVDTLVLARNKFPGSTTSLDALCKRYRIDNSRRVKHTALLDCDLLAKVYINLLDQKEPTLQFQNNDKKNIEDSDEKVLYFKKVISPTEVEMEMHKKYLKQNLKKNFFSWTSRYKVFQNLFFSQTLPQENQNCVLNLVVLFQFLDKLKPVHHKELFFVNLFFLLVHYPHL